MYTPPLTTSDSFRVSSNDFLDQLVLPADIIAKHIDDFIPGGRPVDSGTVVLQWLLVVSVNAQTLTATFVRSAYEHQFLAYGAHIIGLQETRTHKKGIFEYDNYIIAYSPAVKGKFGCEIWFNKNVCWGTKGKKDVYIKVTDINITHSDPRRLVVMVHNEIITCRVSCLHALHQADKGGPEAISK